nr:PhoH family protein [Paenisporosarcina sp. TG20]
MILYGPPGTGKTYNTVNYAVSVIENKTIEQVQNHMRIELIKKDMGLHKSPHSQ